jgi:hypothetical protein
MAIIAYMDESGTHGSETMLMSAWAASEAQWSKFEERATAFFLENDVKIFHAKEWRGGHGDFAGWSMNKKAKFMDDFGALINTTTEIGCTAILKMSDYRMHYVNGVKPKKLQMDTPYGICFRAALAFVAQAAVTLDAWKGEQRTLNVIVEQGHKNAGDVQRLFEMFRHELLERYRGCLGSLTFATKLNCLPLAASDALAYGSYRQEENLKPNVLANHDRSKETYQHNCYRLGIDRDSLISLKADLMRDDELARTSRKRTC